MFNPTPQKYYVKVVLQYLFLALLVLFVFYLGYRFGEKDFAKIIEILK